MNRPPTRNRVDAGAAERGSAYLFVLLGLLVLTIIGLSLVVVTQTEAQIGGAEKSAARILFGADSGLQVQLARHLVVTDPDDGQFEVDDQDIDGFANLVEVIDVSPFYPIYAGPCALCSVNYGSDQRYYVNNYVTNAQSKRFKDLDPGAGYGNGCLETPQGVKLLSQMFLIQPEAQPGGGVDVDIRTYEKGVVYGDFIGTATCTTGLVDIRY